MTRVIIGLVGRIGSGKDEVAKILERRAGFKHIKYATKIKDIAFEFGLLEKGRDDKEVDRTVRINWSDFRQRYPRFATVFKDYPIDVVKQRLQSDLEPYRKRSLNWAHDAEYVISPRRFQQLLGTDVGRGLDDNFWVDATLKDAEGLNVISDVRFPNEVVKCDSIIVVVRNGTVAQDGVHSSEKLAEELLSIVKDSKTTDYLGVPVVTLKNHSKSLAKLSKDVMALIEKL